METTATEKRKILVAVDEGEESIHALRWFLDHQIHEGIPCKLVLLYTQPALPVYSMYGSGFLFADLQIESMDRYRKELADSVFVRAQNICRNYSNIKVEAKACCGDAGKMICDMVEKLEIDILVMGSHGYGFIKRSVIYQNNKLNRSISLNYTFELPTSVPSRALLGSVSDYCARNSKCPVVIVKHAV